MGFLSGRVTLESFRVRELDVEQFGTEHVETLKRFGIDQLQTSATEEPDVGFLAGDHLFDTQFSLEKNIIGDALHAGFRIDTNQVPAALRKAWMQMELAVATADNPGARPTKLQRQEAKEAVEARCEEAAQSGKYRRMQPFSFLWDARGSFFHFGATSPKAGETCCGLFTRAFECEVERLTAGRRAMEWASETKHTAALEKVAPSEFCPGLSSGEITWWNGESDNFDFLGNEFLLWLWWHLETQSDTLTLPDGSEVACLFARTLYLECPQGESGKEAISAESPVVLPEAALAIRSGKLPRKAGLTLARQGEQYDLVLQAETFSISGARIQTEEASEGHGILEDRVESLRNLQQTLDLLFQAFCERRVGKAWNGDLESIRRWLKAEAKAKRRSPAA